jgi:hypothetical protein
MEIKCYTAEQLRSELASNDLWSQKYCPITRHRALSIIKNPRTRRDDHILLVGYLNGEVSGYIAIVPDELFSGEKSVRLGWLGSWWSDPSPANSIMAVRLLMKTYELYDGHIAGFSAAERAEQIFRVSNRFKEFREAVGYQFLLRSNLQYWIPRKYPALRPAGGMLRLADGFVNVGQNMRLRRWRSSHKLDPGHPLEYMTQIHDTDTIEFIREHSRFELTRRNHEDINAMIRYPTSLATVLEDKTKSRYFFSHRTDRFQYLLYRILDPSQKIAAVVLICADGDHLLIPFVFYRENFERTVLISVLHHFIAMRMKMLTTFHPALIEQMRSLKVPRIFTKKRTRTSLISKKINHKPFVHPYMHDGDGA